VIKQVEGLVAAVHTPMHADGQVNLAAIDGQADALVRQRVSGVFVCGSTGEASALTVSERKDILRRWCDVALQDLTVIAHVGQTNLPDVCELARDAASLGVHAISITGPTVLKPQRVEELVAYCQEVGRASRGVPIYYYHTPAVISHGISLLEFLDRASKRVPNLAGVKFNDVDLYLYQQCLRLAGSRFDLPYATDEMLLPALACGARGAVGSTYNYAAPIYHAMIEAFRRGDMAAARACSARSIQLIDHLVRHGVLATGKALMSLWDVDCGPPRTPVTPLPDHVVEQLRPLVRDLIHANPASAVTETH